MNTRSTDMSSVTAAILAGGLGTRLRSVVADRPKVLADVGGRPFLAYLLDRLAAAGLTRVVLCTGHMGDRVEAAFGETHGPLYLVYSREPELLGTAGALRLALPLFESDSILVMNGDSYCEADLQGLYAWHSQKQAEATLLLTHLTNAERYGRVSLAADGRLLNFEEKARAAGPGWINAGVYVFMRDLLRTIPRGKAVSLEREVLPAWVSRRMYGRGTRGRFLDIGTPQSYSLAEELLAQGATP